MNYSHDDVHGSASSAGQHHHHAQAHHQVHHVMHEHHHQVDDDGDRLDEDVQDVHGLDDQDDMTGSHMQHEMSAGLDGEDDEDEGTPMDGDGHRRLRKVAGKRRTKSAQQIMMLTSHFNRDPKPKKVAIKALVLSTGLTYQEICRWFRNQRLRNKQQPHMQTQVVMSQQMTQQHAMQLGLPQPMMPMSGMSADDRDLHKVLVGVHQVNSLVPSSYGLQVGDPNGGLVHLGSPASTVVGGMSGTGSAAGGVSLESLQGSKDDKAWRASSKFRRLRDTFLGVFSDYPKGSDEREQLLKDLVRVMGRADRDILQNLLRPRAPYRGSADPALKMTTKQERAKEVWQDMERRFGAHGRADDETGSPGPVTQANGLDLNMIEGLKVLFKPHRDYLFAVARELEVTDMLKPEVETELKKKLALRQQRRQELEKQKREKRKSMATAPTMLKAPQSGQQLQGSPVKRMRTELSPPPISQLPRPQPQLPSTAAYLQSHDSHGVPYPNDY